MHLPTVPLLAFSAGLLFAVIPAVRSATPPPEVPPRTELELLRALPPDLVARTMRGGKPDARGFVGYQQIQERFEPGLQRAGVCTLAAGVVLRRPAWVEEGWRVLDVTFDHQNADGSLGDVVKPSDRATSVAFFLCWTTRALLLLQSDPEYAKPHAEKIAATLPKLRAAANWLATQTDHLDQGNIHAPNRCFIIANAFAFSAELLDHDAKLAKLGRRYIDVGLKSYQPETGVFAEPGKGAVNSATQGDSSYQAVSILVLNFYQMHFKDERLDEPLHRATKWELGKIDASGEVAVQGNTRTGEGQEIYHNKPKGVNFSEVVQALSYQAFRTHDPASMDAAENVLARNLPIIKK